MKAILYDVHSYERAAFDRANGAKTHQLEIGTSLS